jgi:hypothetical protein
MCPCTAPRRSGTGLGLSAYTPSSLRPTSAGGLRLEHRRIGIGIGIR